MCGHPVFRAPFVENTALSVPVWCWHPCLKSWCEGFFPGSLFYSLVSIGLNVFLCQDQTIFITVAFYRERVHTSRGGAEGAPLSPTLSLPRGREESQAGSVLSPEPDMRPNPTTQDPGIITWAEIKSWTLNRATQVPFHSAFWNQDVCVLQLCSFSGLFWLLGIPWDSM